MAASPMIPKLNEIAKVRVRYGNEPQVGYVVPSIEQDGCWLCKVYHWDHDDPDPS